MRLSRQAGEAHSPLRPQLTTYQRQELFLAAYRKLGVITLATESVRISPKTHYDWLRQDVNHYRDRFSAAHEAVVDMAESELRRRGIKGYDRPVYYQGEVCGAVREYSDACLIFYLKGRRSDVFRDQVAHMGPGGGPILSLTKVQVEFVDAAQAAQAAQAQTPLEAQPLAIDSAVDV